RARGRAAVDGSRGRSRPGVDAAGVAGNDPRPARAADRRGDPVKVASAPVSFGIFELTAGDSGLPDPVDVLDAIAETGHDGTELGPPGYFGDAAGTSAALQERNLELVGSFLPLRLSRREHIDEDFAF